MSFPSRQRFFLWSSWQWCPVYLPVVALLLISAGATIAQASATPGTSQTTDAKDAGAKAAGKLDRARQLLNTSNWENAEPLVKAYLDMHPDSADGHALMGLILYRERQPRASMAQYLRASQSGDLSAFDLRIFALDCAAIPDFPEAEKWMLRSIERDDREIGRAHV